MNEHQERMSDILQEIIHNEKEKITEYYGNQICTYQDEVVDKYLSRLEDINDKIFLAQWCNNFNKAEELIGMLELTDYQKQKYEALRTNNADINETLNFKILSEKYSFLSDILDMIVTDKDTQDQILSLSDELLMLFKLMYLRLKELTDYPVPYVDTILKRIGYVSLKTSWKNKYHIYDDLLSEIETKIRNGGLISNNEIDTLLYLCTSSVHHTVPSYSEMQNFGEPNTIDQLETKKLLEEGKNTKDLDIIKSVLLIQTYGIGLQHAQEICSKYDIKGIEVTSEFKDIFEMYMAIYQIVHEENPDILLELYEEFTKALQPKKDFRRIIVFENELRKAFARDLNNKVYKVEDKTFTEQDGVKIYDAGLDLKMIVTALGAYQGDFANQENYSEYWNSPTIRSHGNCCSLIGNTNLSTAKIRTILLGFSSMNDNMLLLSGSYDINSTPGSRNFNTTLMRGQKFMSPNALLDNTRADYNELVYERRDLSANPRFYKKNPDYIVFIEEYESFPEILNIYRDNPEKTEYLKKQKEDQDRIWQESLKAAKNFGIPIVKINRERVAKSEFAIINNMLSEFEETKNPMLIGQIITRFENNRVGNSGLHAPIREKYFSEENMSKIIYKLKLIISKEPETNRNNLYLALYKAILEEWQKEKKVEYKKENNHLPGIKFSKELTDLEHILEAAQINYTELIGRIK